jgi:hypothetical protein
MFGGVLIGFEGTVFAPLAKELTYGVAVQTYADAVCSNSETPTL